MMPATAEAADQIFTFEFSDWRDNSQ